MKRFRWRKVNPTVLEKMKELRNSGLFYHEIAKKLNLSINAIAYHLNPKAKERKRIRARKDYKRLTKKQKKAKSQSRKEYIREYIMDRYHKDEEFRNRYKEIIRRSERKRLEKRRKLRLCIECGKKLKDKYKTCSKCREKGRLKYESKKI